MKNLFSKVLILFVLAFIVSACGAKAPMDPAAAVKANMAEAKKQTKQISIVELQELQASGEKFMLIDARTRKEHAAGFIPGSVNIPRGLIEFLVPKSVKDTSKKLIVYCKVGGRGLLTTKTLVDIGYTNVVNLTGGYMAWSKAGYPVEKK